jgi:hypothetical protein
MNIRKIFGLLALLSLLVCVAMPILFFIGEIEKNSFHAVFLVASLLWFVFSVLWNIAKK